MQTLTRENTIQLPTTQGNKINIYPLIFCTIYGCFSDYFFLAVIAGFTLTMIISKLWQPYVPPVLLYYFVFHWAQIFTVVPYIDFLDGNVDHNGQYVDINLTTYQSQFLVGMSLLQLAAMAMVVSYYTKSASTYNSFSIRRAVLQLNTKKILLAFFVSTLIFPFLLSFTRSNPSLNQLVQSAAVFRKVFLLLLIFILFTKRDRYKSVIITILVVEFLLGFTSFFSDFKEIILYILVVYLTTTPSIKPIVLFKLTPALFFLTFILVFWSYVKPSYREFISGGARQQVVVVSKDEALNYLWGSLQKFDQEAFRDGVEILLERIENMTLYFKVYERVPKLIKYEEGENTMSTIKFLTLPRSLNPNKAILDPSTKSTYYTGIRFMNAEQGTSIAMGYFPDFYVDFGIYGMFLPLILLACFIGWASKKILMNHNYNTLFNYCLLIGTVFSIGNIESDLTFLLGGFRNLLVLFMLGNWVIFPWLNKVVTNVEEE